MTKLSSDEQMTAILAYLGILLLIPLLVVKKKNDFIKFHLKQGIVLFAVEIIAWVAFAILSPFLFFIVWPLISLIEVLFLILIIIAIIKAFQGEKWEMPVLGGFMKNVPENWVK